MAQTNEDPYQAFLRRQRIEKLINKGLIIRTPKGFRLTKTGQRATDTLLNLINKKGLTIQSLRQKYYINPDLLIDFGDWEAVIKAKRKARPKRKAKGLRKHIREQPR
ncbi:MAG: hypothetical protein Q7K42_05320 [Candidatus Diapherotrites archaeon]|nr:hypothetical protein [Candidatus Diapherotrites archaeon]